jgi:hypothetical protein
MQLHRDAALNCLRSRLVRGCGRRLASLPDYGDYLEQSGAAERHAVQSVAAAVTYFQPGGRMLVGCRRSVGYVRIDVHDTGIGIAPVQLPRIFDAFQRVGSTQADGLGIGLFIVRRAVDLPSHRIEVRSMVSRGSRFSSLARPDNREGRRLTQQRPAHAYLSVIGNWIAAVLTSGD